MGNILVCDDERSICELLDIALRRDGHKVETVTSGDAAKRKIDSALFDVIVTDIKMPGVDGVEVRGDTVLIHCGDSDAVARQLLTQTPARDLEITARGLEDAFIALTGDGTAGPTDESQAAT